MALPPASNNTYAHLRMPLENQKNIGGDMSIFFITRLSLPNKFVSSEQQQIKGLNFETIATVHFPLPTWLYHSEYTALQPQADGDNTGSALFSLNLSIYN